MSGRLAVLASRQRFRTAAPPADPPVATTLVIGGGASVVEGSTTQLTATIYDQYGTAMTGQTVAWSSSDDVVASVDSDGIVTAHEPGSVSVTASSGLLTDTHALTVTSSAPAPLTAGTDAANAGDGQVVVSWTPPTGGVSPYSVALYRSTDGSLGALIPEATSSPYVDTNVVNDTTYYYTPVGTDSATPPASVSYTQKSAKPLSAGTPLFSDSFESGDLSHVENGVRWNSPTKAASTDQPLTGSYAYKATFLKNPVGFDGSSPEQRLYFGAHYPEIWIDYQIYIPANWYHHSNYHGVTFTNCAMTAGSASLTAPAGTFTDDNAGEGGLLGKAIKVPGAGRLLTGVSMDAASVILNAAPGTFSAADKQKWVSIPGAGAGGADLVTSIASYVSDSQVKLVVKATTAVSGIEAELLCAAWIIDVVSDAEVTLDVPADRSVSGVTVTRLASDSANNKWLPVWGASDSAGLSGQKPGYDSTGVNRTMFTFETNPTAVGVGAPGDSGLHLNLFGTAEGSGIREIVDPFIGGSGMVRGQYNRFRFHAKMSSGPGAADGIGEIWVNDTKYVIGTTMKLWPTGTDPETVPDFTHCYFMGWENTGHFRDFTIYIDDVRIYASDPGWT